MDWFLYDNSLHHERVKTDSFLIQLSNVLRRGYTEIFLSEHFMKYVFHDRFIV